jgi:hypothetical protein
VVRVSFRVGATSYMDHVRMHLRCSIEGKSYFKDIPSPDLAAYLVNKYAEKLLVSEYGLGYDAELPENAVMALEYLFIARKTSVEELDWITASGRTKLHILREELGFPADVPVQDLFLKDISSKGFNLCFRDFPRLKLYSDGGSIRVEFNAETVEKAFLKRVLEGGLEEVERRMLCGITLLGREAQEKYTMLLSRGELSIDDVAKALLKSALQSKDKRVWLAAVDWLKANGYGRQAGEVVARKTVCN